MPPTNVVHARARNRNPLAFSFSLEEERRRDNLIRAAWMLMVAGFDCRPFPRGVWDETATGDQTPWRTILPPIRGACSQAALSGDSALINQTRDGVRAFCRELEADFLSLLPPEEEESATQIALAETELQSEAEPLEMAFVASPTSVNADRAVLPLQRHYETLGKLIKRLRITARQARPQMASRLTP